mmetsp:Transcript_32925/g.72304  ORF Transcript_32925/g.72304 Transcript_32925/m.72304 type:complete len:146 (+) Transcript_32925:414-851(+)
MESLRQEEVGQLRAIFDAFDHDSDGLLDKDEVSAILVRFGLVLTEAEVLDVVTELNPMVRKLPFEDFVAVACRPMKEDDIQAEVMQTFSFFAADESEVTASSLHAAMATLGLPVSTLMSEDMINEADLDQDGKVNLDDYRNALMT